jgi:hypothetical protein
MRRVAAAVTIAGVLAGLTVFVLSNRGWLHSQPSKAPQQTHDRAPTLLSRAGAAAVTPRLNPAPTSAPGPDPRSEQLQVEIQRALDSNDPDARYRAYTQLVPALLAIDPEAMKRLVENSPPGSIHEELLHHTSRAWSAVNVTGAIQWANGMTDQSERVTAANEIVSQLGQTDPAQAIEVADVLGVGRNDGSVEHIALLWAAQDLHASLQWVEAQPPGVQRDRLLARVNTLQQPAVAASTALNEISPGPIQEDAIANAVRSWSYQDAAAASQWVGDLPQGRLRDLAKAALVRPK